MSTLKQQKPFGVAVIGAGRMGAGGGAPDDSFGQSHAGAIRKSPGLALLGVVDPDERAREAAGKWGAGVYANVEGLLKACDGMIDAVVISTPAEARESVLKAFNGVPLKCALLEKPVAVEIDAALRVRDLVSAWPLRVIVNYTRRFVPFYQDLKAGLDSFGAPLSVSIRYGKGINHNGTHAIDLVRFLFGEIINAKALSARQDHAPDDPTVASFLTCETCPSIFLIPLDERCYTHFEVDIFFSKVRFIIDQDGARVRRYDVQDGVGVPPGRRLCKTEAFDSGVEQAAMALYENLVDVCNGGEPLCSIDDGITAMKVAKSLQAPLEAGFPAKPEKTLC